jgi:hypothetical protein
MIDHMGAGVWYHGRWSQTSLMALEQAACWWVLGHCSMCHTFSLRWQHGCKALLVNLVANVSSVAQGWSPFMCILGDWSCQPGARALKDEPFTCQSTNLKVSSVHLVLIMGSHFLESLMMVSWRALAVAAVVTWWSCFFVTRWPQ